MEIEKWIEIEDMFTSLVGHSKGIGSMVEIKRDVAPKKPIYELSKREDEILLHRLRKQYGFYKEHKYIVNENLYNPD
jgi:hypothetical protein